jgi:AcrR family transcriptional regulator
MDILLAAADVLRRNGYEATTMKDIAAQVNLTAASLYHHFKSKDFLLLSVLETGLQVAIDQMERILHTPQPCADRLRAMITGHIVDVTANPAVGAAMVFEIRSLMNARPGIAGSIHSDAAFIERRDAFFRQRDAFENLFRRIIKEGIAAGEFREVDAAVFTRAMLGAHNWVGVWYRPGGRLTGQEVAAIMADTFITSLTGGLAEGQPAPLHRAQPGR